MRTASIGAVVGLVVSAGLAHAQALIRLEVSRGLQEDWHETIQAAPGDSVDVRVTATYNGSASPIGLGTMIFQPTVSNWLAGEDVMLPLVNGGAGSQTTDPIGAVPDAPGQYGRVIPFARIGLNSSNHLMGHVNTDQGVTYLRIAQAQVTSWFGGPGNTSGGSGVNIGQLANGTGRTTSDPPFFPGISGVVIFKFGIILSAQNTSSRTMAIDAPVIGFGNRDSQGHPAVTWYGGLTETPPGSIHGEPSVVPGRILVSVPAPGGVVALGFLFACGARRRRRRARLCGAASSVVPASLGASLRPLNPRSP